MAEIFIIDAETSPVRICVNGRAVTIPVGVNASIPDAMVPALATFAMKWRFTGSIAPIGEDGEATPAFDPDGIIAGTVADVAARLADLTGEQLIAVREAECDREVSRKGVLDAITKAITDRNQGTPK